jgi:nitrate reductase beta subunit
MITAPIFADMSKKELQDMYLAYLRGRNVKASIDSDGDIQFEYKLPTYQVMTFYIIVDEEDQEYFRIVKYNLQSLNTAQDKRMAPIASAYATKAADTVKMYVNSDGNNVSARGEVFLVSPGNFRFAFPKMMLQFEEAFNTFLNRMK